MKIKVYPPPDPHPREHEAIPYLRNVVESLGLVMDNDAALKMLRQNPEKLDEPNKALFIQNIDRLGLKHAFHIGKMKHEVES